MRWRVGESREPPCVNAAVSGPVSAVADTASPLGCPRCQPGCQRRTEQLWCAYGASRLAVRCAHSSRYARQRSRRRTGQRSAAVGLSWPSTVLDGAGLPPPRAGLPGHCFLSPPGCSNVLDGTLHLATPIAPQGARGRHRLRPCPQKGGICWGEQRAPPSALPGRTHPSRVRAAGWLRCTWVAEASGSMAMGARFGARRSACS
jgi:hypothetical protein